MNQLKFREESIGNIPTNNKLLGLAVAEISPTDLCNRTCSFCPRSDPNIYPNNNKHMSLETATLLKEQLQNNNFSGYVCVAGYGEPLLNPKITSIINILSYHYVELITNGDNIINDKYTIDSLFDSGVSRILLSDYDNNPVLEDFANRYNNIKVRKYLDDGKDHYAEYSFSNRSGALFSIDKPIQRPCYIPAYKAMIDWNGDVLLCSHDWSKKVIFGNIHDKDISEIWNSQDFVHRRIELAKGNRHLFKECSNCSVLGNIMGEKYANLWL
jgi:radical SAM protein with 4Fe4S-binding SPASM domain